MARVDLNFDKPGTLPRPGPLGRLYRLAMGAVCIFVVSLVWQFRGQLLGGDLNAIASLSLPILFGLLVVNYVVNIGFGVPFGRWPQAVSIGIAAITAVAGQLAYGSPWAPPLGIFLALWLVYVYAHLGISFLLAAALATPGCEMRAFADLRGKRGGVPAVEHYCPIGIMQPLDNWEARQSWMRR